MLAFVSEYVDTTVRKRPGQAASRHDVARRSASSRGPAAPLARADASPRE
jgi:hypothetical protein